MGADCIAASSSHVLDRGTGASPNLPNSAHTAHQGGLVLWYSTEILTRHKIWDTAGYKGFYMTSLKACAYRRKGMMILPRGNARYSVRPWRVWN